MQFDKILSYTDELLADLDALMRIESVDVDNNEACQQALDYMLSRAQDFGRVPERVTDKSGQVDLGSGGKVCGVLSHLDVVPVGNSWTVPPFALTERDGRRYGA